jgi:hypothetical protein
MNQEAAEFASSIVTIGPKRAAEMLGSMQYEHQRPVSKSQVSLYANEMKAGRFVPGTTIRVAHIDGRSKLLDGQHRLYAVIASGTEQVFTLLEEFAPDNEYIAWAYGSIDTGRRRAHADLYRAMELTARLGLTNNDINDLAPGLGFMMSGMKTPSGSVVVDRTERIRLMELYAPYMRRFLDLTGGCEKAMRTSLKRSYVIAVAMLTLRFSEPFADRVNAPSVADFWRGVAFDDEIALGDPRKLANRHLLTTALTSPSQAKGLRTLTTAPHAARHLMGCFNAYMARENRHHVKVMDDHAPVKLWGVPDPDLWGK